MVAEFMTLDEVADYLRVTTKTVYRLLEKSAIPATKVGRQWRFDRDAIDAWLRQNSRKAGGNILVIDDDESICNLFKDTLEGSGYTVTTTNTSLWGLELVKNQNYNMVFLDLKMPGMDGVELFRQIRLTKASMPVTIITGYPDTELMMSALTYGPLAVMKKPFRESDILDAVNNYTRFGQAT